MSELYVDKINGRAIIDKVDIPLQGTGKYLNDLTDGGYDVTIKPGDLIIKNLWVDARVYGTNLNSTTLFNAINDIGSNRKTLYLSPGDWYISTNLTIPENILLKLETGAIFSIAKGIVLTLNSQVEAGNYQIFTGEGTAVLNNLDQISHDEWFGYTPATVFKAIPRGPLVDPIEDTQLVIKAYVDRFRSDIPSGTKMIFYQTAAPLGWTQVTTLNDRVLRVVNGFGGGVGGDWIMNGLMTAGHALTAAELASHRHLNLQAAHTYGHDSTLGVLIGNFQVSTQYTEYTGGGQEHTHEMDNTLDWRPAYVDVIICAKD